MWFAVFDHFACYPVISWTFVVLQFISRPFVLLLPVYHPGCQQSVVGVTELPMTAPLKSFLAHTGALQVRLLLLLL